MNEILCSTGALLGRPNNRDYRHLKELFGQLVCDGLELMVYDSWYPEAEEMMRTLAGFDLPIPVVHCQKSLSEQLSGGIVRLINGEYIYYEMTTDEDEKNFERAILEFKLNLDIASCVGADRMVLHLWNGLISDRNIRRNVERFGRLKEMAEKKGILLMVENVICNTHDPMYDMRLVYEAYPDVSFVFDTKMAEFHGQTALLFEEEWRWMLTGGHIRHFHINDYGGGLKDWGNLRVLPIGKGHVDFASFFSKLKDYDYSGDYTVEATAFGADLGQRVALNGDAEGGGALLAAAPQDGPSSDCLH